MKRTHRIQAEQTLDQITTELREFYSLEFLDRVRNELHARYCNQYFGAGYPQNVFEAELLHEYQSLRKRAIDGLDYI